MNNPAGQSSGQRRFLVYHLPVILYAIGIIVISSIPNLKGPQLRIIAFDKLAHFFEYAVFAYLAFRSFIHIGSNMKLRRALLLSALFLTFFALLDETFQHFIPGRHYDLLDYVTDVGGALFVLAILGFQQRRNSAKEI